MDEHRHRQRVDPVKGRVTERCGAWGYDSRRVHDWRVQAEPGCELVRAAAAAFEFATGGVVPATVRKGGLVAS